MERIDDISPLCRAARNARCRTPVQTRVFERGGESTTAVGGRKGIEKGGFDEPPWNSRKQKTRHGGRVFSGAVASPCTRRCDVAWRHNRSGSGGGGALRVAVHARRSSRSDAKVAAPSGARRGPRGPETRRRVRRPGGQKKRPASLPAFRGSGGGGGSRTRVRKPSDPGSTCLARSIVSRRHVARGAGHA